MGWIMAWHGMDAGGKGPCQHGLSLSILDETFRVSTRFTRAGPHHDGGLGVKSARGDAGGLVLRQVRRKAGQGIRRD